MSFGSEDSDVSEMESAATKAREEEKEKLKKEQAGLLDRNIKLMQTATQRSEAYYKDLAKVDSDDESFYQKVMKGI